MKSLKVDDILTEIIKAKNCGAKDVEINNDENVVVLKFYNYLGEMYSIRLTEKE